MSLLFLCSLLSAILCNASPTALPKRSMGFYLLIADDTVKGYESTSIWQPQIYDYQINGSNVIWLTFINPQTMPLVPPAMAKLAQCKGQSGCPPTTTPVIFSIGGYSYSQHASQWPWLQSESAALAMAANVSTWDKLYGADGIDLDIEGPAGNSGSIGANLVAFAQKVKELNPTFMITQPVYGYPQVTAENDMVNNAWSTNGQSKNLIESIGLMVYSDLTSLQYVKDYSNGANGGGAIKVNVPTTAILAGIQGPASSSTIGQMASDVNSQNLGGIMVWFASVWDKTNNRKALSYGAMDATTTNATNGAAWAKAMQTMQ